MHSSPSKIGPAIGLVLGLASACGDDFAPANQISGVRILATRADLPYARPGEQVTLTTLALDGRSDRSRPMRVAYLKTPCTNPSDDDPTACYARIAASFPLGSNLDASLAATDTFSFTMPADAITTHAPARGGDGYGVAYVFVVACAGHVERVETRGSYPGEPPLGCFDAGGRRLGREDFVFAFARVYAYADLRNDNPSIGALTLDGVTVDERVGMVRDRCTANADQDCAKSYLDVITDFHVQEEDPAASTPGLTFREQVWVSYFLTGGRLEDDISILYDSRDGKIPKSRNALTTRSPGGRYLLYAVLHDNRGGASWKSYSLEIR